MVTWVEYVFLIPRDRKIDTVTTDGIKNFQISPDYSRVAFTDNKKDVWVANIKSNEQKKLYSHQENDQNVEVISFSQNNRNLLAKRTTSNGAVYELITEADAKPIKSTGFDIKKIEFTYNTDDQFFAISDTKLYSLTKDEALIRENEINNFAQSSNSIFFVKSRDKKSEIWKAGFDFKTKNKLQVEESNKINIFPGKKEKIVYTTGPENALIYWHDNQREKINSGVTDVQWTKDDKKIAYKTNGEIDAYTFQPENPKESKNQITTRLSNKIDQISWFFDSKHIVYKTGHEVILIENDGDNPVVLANSAAKLNVLTTTKIGKTLIFAVEENGLINIKVMKLSD